MVEIKMLKLVIRYHTSAVKNISYSVDKFVIYMNIVCFYQRKINGKDKLLILIQNTYKINDIDNQVPNVKIFQYS